MGEVAVLDRNIPAHLKKLSVQQDDWESGTTGGFPVLSIEGKTFHIRRGGESELVISPDDPDAPASSLLVVVLRAHSGVAKTYYEKAYTSGADDKPTCYSVNGVEPAIDAEDKQAAKCAICPHNQWGSRISDSGAKAKKCSDVKRLAVAPAGQLNDPMLLKVPPTSLKVWDQYVEMLRKKGLTPTHVITKVTFDFDKPHPLLILKVHDFVDAGMLESIEEALALPVLDTIVGTAEGDALANTAPEEPEPTPAPKKRTRKKAAPKKETPPEPVVDQTEEEPEEDEDDDLGDLDFDDLDFGDDED